jgi:hypothetical protein
MRPRYHVYLRWSRRGWEWRLAATPNVAWWGFYKNARLAERSARRSLARYDKKAKEKAVEFFVLPEEPRVEKRKEPS